MSARERILITVVALGLIAAARPASAQRSCTPRPVALFESVRNSVEVVQASTRAAIRAARQFAVCAGDRIQVGDNSRAVIVMLASNTPLVIDQNSEFIVTEPSAGQSYVDLLRGALLFITRVRRSIQIRTPFVNAAIEGTEFVVRVQADRTVITVFEGTVRASNDLGMVLVGAGQQAVALQNQAPQLQITVRPRDAVQWALYYEPVLPVSSLEQLAAVPEAGRDAAFYVRRAGLLLAAGQLDQARVDLDQAQKLDPSNGDAYALRAIVAVALNDKDGALSNGRTAVERAPRSASAQLALSYALQANLQLEAARDAALRATELEPANAGALARLAEVRLMLDDVGGAVAAAREAVKKSPQVARAQVVLGFTLLAQLKPSDAREAFQRAIDLEPDNPLARLGMGLTRIRQGKLAEGRADLELAMALNPDDALIRSYVGKAYFEEKREPLPEEQFALAKQLDAQDPTPYFYDAIRKQVLNRPVEALRDVERSISLNDNRAVYRSRFLLDQDLAARGARLGRIYRDLGFEQLALLEGWKSVVVDPTDHSAHRLLADNYLVLPRHKIARDSELLQAQLLQPLNLNPVQPLLADNGLTFLLDPAISGIGFNEFTRLFATDQLRLVADGIVGDHSTASDNVIHSAVFRRLSYSVGQFHYETDGIRPNNDVKEDIYNAFVQGSITPATSVHFEARSTDVDLGDRRMLFDPQNFLPRLRNPFDTKSIRVGARQTIAPGSVLIGAYTHRTLDAELNTGTGLRVLTEENADFTEVRHIQEWRILNITGGFGHYGSDRSEARTVGPRQLPVALTTIEHTNAYIYADAALLQPLSLSVGISHDDYDSGVLQRRPTNPKFGFTWQATPRTTVRGAAFKAFKRTLVLSQTIEPTNVAGFNQFFDDTTASESWRQGLALDREISGSLRSGAEVSHRSLETPSRSAATGAVSLSKENEWLGRAYLYSSVFNWLAVTTEYRYERLVRDPLGNNAGLLANSTTHTLAGEARAFWRLGTFGRLRATFVDQDGMFQNPRQVVVPGQDRFWTFDISLGYRLPRQWGVVAVDSHNALNHTFNFQDTTPEEPTILPRRTLTLRLTLAL